MSNTMYAKITKNVTPETPGQRNRRLFCKAVAAGCRVVREEQGEFTVTSKSSDRLYIVTLDFSDEGRDIIHCTCDWGSRFGWMLNSGKSPLCCHQNVVRWHILDPEDQAAIITIAPDIAQALVVGGYVTLAADEARDFADALAGITELHLGLFLQHVGLREVA